MTGVQTCALPILARPAECLGHFIQPAILLGFACFDGLADRTQRLRHRIHALVDLSHVRGQFGRLLFILRQLVVQLDEGSNAQCTGLSFEVAPDSDFAAMSRQLESEGIEHDLSNDSIPGMGKVLKFKDPKGTTIELFSEWNFLGHNHQVIGVGPLKLGHVAFVVDDAKKITELESNSDHYHVTFTDGKWEGRTLQQQLVDQGAFADVLLASL